MLVLTETTLFYHNLRSMKISKAASGLIADWAEDTRKRSSSKSTISKGSRRGAGSSAVYTASSTTAAASGRTTTSSNAAISAKNIRPKKQVEADDGVACGFLEDGEAVECEAALSSPVKGNQRLTSSVSGKIKPILLILKYGRPLSRLRTFHHPPSGRERRSGLRTATSLQVPSIKAYGAVYSFPLTCSIYRAERLKTRGSSGTTKPPPSCKRSGTSYMEQEFHTP